MALLMLSLSAYLLQAAAFLIFGTLLLQHPLLLWVLNVVSIYVVGFGLFIYFIHRTPEPPLPEPGGPLGGGAVVKFFFISVAAMYLLNFLTVFLVYLIDLVRDSSTVNPVDTMADYPLVCTVLLACVIAPLVEETMFRRLMLNRLRPYGDGFAIFLSALAFALFHGNLNQVLYAFGVGIIFGYIAVRTGGIRITVLLHALVNFVGAVLVPPVSESTVFTALLGLFVVVAIILGITFFVQMVRRIRLASPEIVLPPGRRWRYFFLSPGVLCFVLLALLLIVSYYIV